MKQSLVTFFLLIFFLSCVDGVNTKAEDFVASSSVEEFTHVPQGGDSGDSAEKKKKIPRLRNLASTSILGDSLEFPVVATAIVPSGSRAWGELDLLSLELTNGPDGSKTVTFLVHNGQEMDMISNLQGLDQLSVDDELTRKFKADNHFYDGAAAATKTTTAKMTTSSLFSSGKTYPTVANYDCYRNLAGTFQFINDIATEYPDLVQVIDIGDSHLKNESTNEGYDLLLLHVTAAHSSASDKAQFMATFGVHAREMAPPELGMRWIEILLSGYGENADITAMLDHTDLHILLQSNPDGRFIAETQQTIFQRKNMNELADCDPGRIGVDLNRNFPFKWSEQASSSAPCSQSYHGPGEASEVETQAIVNYATSIFPESNRKDDPEGVNLQENYPDTNTGVFIDVHSYGEIHYWPGGFHGEGTANDIALETISRKFCKKNGHKLAGFRTNGYLAVSGATEDWAYGKLGVSSHTFELGTAFYQNCDYFESSIVSGNLEALLYGVRVARAPFRMPMGPDVVSWGGSFSSSTDIPSLTKTSTLSIVAEVSDAEWSTLTNSQGNGLGRTVVSGGQNIASVSVFVDEYPYDSGSPTGFSMIPEDGSFNSGTETVSYALFLAGYSNGRHIMHVQATDSDGYTGPVFSRFFDVEVTPSSEPTLKPVQTSEPSALTDAPTPRPTLKLSSDSTAPTADKTSEPSALTNAPTPRPTLKLSSDSTAPTPDATPYQCRNDPQWQIRVFVVFTKSCSWVDSFFGIFRSLKCSRVGMDGRTGTEACPVSCNSCP